MKGILKKIPAFWSSLSPPHRQRAAQAAALCLALIVAAVLAARSMSGGEPVTLITADIGGAAEKQAAETPSPAGASLSFIVTGLGLNGALTEKAIGQLPPSIGLAFSPYAPNTKDWVARAKAAGHEAFIMIPMESARYPEEDPGPQALSSLIADSENAENLEWVLKKAEGADGAINFLGSALLKNRERMTAVFEALQKKDMIFIEQKNSDASVASAAAQNINLPYLSSQVVIEGALNEGDMASTLEKLEKITQETKSSVGVAEISPALLETLSPWADGLKGKGLTLAPARTVWKNTPRHDEKPAPAPEPAPSKL